MNNFYLLKSKTRWDGRPPRPIPKVVEGPMSKDAAERACKAANEAEGMATDGPYVEHSFQVIEGLTS